MVHAFMTEHAMQAVAASYAILCMHLLVSLDPSPSSKAAAMTPMQQQHQDQFYSSSGNIRSSSKSTPVQAAALVLQTCTKQLWLSAMM
jgi:hypothetical protein